MGKRVPLRTQSTAVALGLCVLLLVSGLFLVGCSQAEEQATPQRASSLSSKQATTGPLKVAVQYNALSIPTVFAADKGYFEEAGIEVELSTFVNGAEENKALEKGDVDMASDGLASVYLLATGEFSWIGESDDGSATVGVYLREGSAPTQIAGQLPDNPDVMGSSDTLRNLVVVGPAGTMEEWAAISYFSQFGLSSGTDFQFIEMDRDNAVDSVLKGSADVFIATDVDYCHLMEENGFVAVAKGSEATTVPFNNGYLVSNKVLETRYDDLVAFLVAVYRAAETLHGDPDLWADFAYQFYKDNGKPATLEDVQEEIAVRALILPADLTETDYRLGSGVLEVGQFNALIGALEPEQVELIARSINPQLLDDAFGVVVQPATLEEV